MFSSIGIILFKALTNFIRCSRAVASEEDSALLTITNNIFHFVDLYKEDISVICNSKR